MSNLNYGSIYVLELTDGKYYVGYSINVDDEIKKHYTDTGSEWTSKYQPVNIVSIEPGTIQDEIRKTKELMIMYGMENVRGGPYCQIKLPDNVYEVLNLEFEHLRNECFRCGSVDHFIKDCEFAACTIHINTEKYCGRCGRQCHNIGRCHENMHKNGLGIGILLRICERCGRRGHGARFCYFPDDMEGNVLYMSHVRNIWRIINQSSHRFIP